MPRKAGLYLVVSYIPIEVRLMIVYYPKPTGLATDDAIAETRAAAKRQHMRELMKKQKLN